MKSFGMTAAVLFFLFNSVPTLAQEDPYYQISSVKTELKSVEEIQTPSEELNPVAHEESALMSPNFLEGGDPLSIVDLISKVWDIIKDGVPVVNVQYKKVDALPQIANGDWQALANWKATERVLTYAVSCENLMGIKTVDLEYQVKLRYGGSVNGKGRYIAHAIVKPKKVDVSWGYNLDVSVEIPSIVNLGSKSDPLAAINMDVTYKISSMLRSYSESHSYELRGDGLMKSNGKIVYAASSR